MSSESQRALTITRRAALRALSLTAAAAGLGVGVPATAAPTGEVRIGLAAEPNTFDPHLTVGRNTQIFVVRPDGRVCGRFRATGIRPKCSDHFAQSGLDVPRTMFDHVQLVN